MTEIRPSTSNLVIITIGLMLLMIAVACQNPTIEPTQPVVTTDPVMKFTSAESERLSYILSDKPVWKITKFAADDTDGFTDLLKIHNPKYYFFRFEFLPGDLLKVYNGKDSLTGVWYTHHRTATSGSAWTELTFRSVPALYDLNQPWVLEDVDSINGDNYTVDLVSYGWYTWRLRLE